MNQSHEFSNIFRKASTDSHYLDEVTAYLSHHATGMDHQAPDGATSIQTTVTFHDNSMGIIEGEYWSDRLTYHPCDDPVVTNTTDSGEAAQFIAHMKDLQTKAVRANVESGREQIRRDLLQRV